MAGINGPYTAGSVISSSVINARFSDIETEITDSLNRSGKGGMLAALRGTDGTVTAPAISFTSETGTGLYRIGSSDLGLSINQAKTGEWTANGYRSANGAVATPSLSFFNDTGSGLYRIGSNDIGFAINGALVQEWVATGASILGTLGQTLAGSSTTTAYAALEASLANAASVHLVIGGASSTNASGGISYTKNATAASSTMCMNVFGQTTSLCVNGNNNTTAGNDLTVTGIVTGAEFLCSTFGVSGTRCGNVSANGSGDATVTIASGFHACNCSDAGVVTPAATGCNISGTTLTIKTGANHVINYLCY